METPKGILQNQVNNFKKWWSANYTKEQIEDLNTDDPGYPDWAEIEKYFKELLKNNLIKELNTEDQINLLLLIARNWDLGRMIGWLSEKNPLSNLGNLDERDFIMLAKTLITVKDQEFNDAKSQFASSFKKFKKLTPEIEEILLDYFKDNHDYTKLTSLEALGKLGYSELMNLIENSWDYVDEEQFKICCLETIDTYVKDKDLLYVYLNLAEKIEGKYLQKTVQRIRNKENFSL
jgi:hypothetical protein